MQRCNSAHLKQTWKIMKEAIGVPNPEASVAYEEYLDINFLLTFCMYMHTFFYLFYVSITSALFSAIISPNSQSVAV